MRTKTRNVRGAWLIGVLALSGAAPTPVVAQQRPMFELPALEVEAWRLEHLDTEALHGTPERWNEAAALHEAAAAERPAYDAKRFFDFRRAAILYEHAGSHRSARRAMERAAEVAEATGDVLTAAHAWVDAAFLAAAEGYPGKRRELVRNAVRLAGSELITFEQRRAVLARISGTLPGSDEDELIARGGGSTATFDRSR